MLTINKCKSFWRIYFGLAWQGGGSPLCDHAFTDEKEGQKRTGKGFLIRFPFCGHKPTVGLVIGVWRKK